MNAHPIPVAVAFVAGLVLPISSPGFEISGEHRQWHRITITVPGPATSETDEVNPFADRRFDVRFDHAESGESFVVPGFFAADGNAAETGAESGDRWRARFTPTRSGRWTWRARILEGEDIALPARVDEPAFDGPSGTLEIGPSDKAAPDLRAPDRGLLRHAGDRYLRFTGSGNPFLKGGPGAPENFLAYHEFDGTYDTGGHGGREDAGFLHRYEPHLRDWREGDPTWGDGRGKGIIGALNYIASKGMRSIYFMVYTIDGGDGKDLWPWIDHETRDRFDCSKLDQWEIVFSHLQRLGIVMNFFLQEQENDQGLDGGELGRTRRLYFRELIARFGHHPGLIWNLGEENTNTTDQQKAFCRFFAQVDPYGHPIAVHTFPPAKDEVYGPLLGFEHLHVASLQIGAPERVHRQTLEWIRRSAEAGHPWAVPLDEIGPANRGVDPDDRADNNQGNIRHHVVWGNLMAGGSGVEHYFGYQNPHGDLDLEDWRSRDRVWDFTRHAVEFFDDHLPFDRMECLDGLTEAEDDFVFARDGEIYAVYLPAGGAGAELDLRGVAGPFTVRWFDPRKGGELAEGSITEVAGGGVADLGAPPEAPDEDWVVLVRSTQSDPPDPDRDLAPFRPEVAASVTDRPPP